MDDTAHEREPKPKDADKPARSTPDQVDTRDQPNPVDPLFTMMHDFVVAVRAAKVLGSAGDEAAKRLEDELATRSGHV